MSKTIFSRLWILRILGITFLLTSTYIVYFTLSSGKPRSFWENLGNKINVYEIPGQFEDQDGKNIALKALSGKNAIVTFVFKDCGMTCPLIMQDLRSFERVTPTWSTEGQFIVIMLEDHRGKSADLREFLKRYQITSDHWRVLTTDAKTLRSVADAFKIEYKKGDKGEYMYLHSNYFAVADKRGKIKQEIRGLERDKAKFADLIQGAL